MDILHEPRKRGENKMEDKHNEHNHDNHNETTIIVNARPKKWGKKEISYEEVIILAFGSYSDDENVVYTVTFAKGDGPHHEGFLVKGKSVKVKEEMIFNVTQTNKS